MPGRWVGRRVGRWVGRRSVQQESPDTGVSVGLLVASALAPGTFASSLSARSAQDQGLVTGLATGLHYLLTVGTQDTLQAVAAEAARTHSPRRPQDPVAIQRVLTLAADLAVIPLGLALQRALPPRPGEAMMRGALRQRVVGALAGAAYCEHVASSAVGRGLASLLPGGPQLWKLAGHVASLGLLGAVGVRFYGRAMRRIEAGTSAQDPVLETDEATRWTTSNVSGGPGSLVPWESLGREGRRHALTSVRPHPLLDRPTLCRTCPSRQ
jgi:uncharacterized membrane protein